MPLTKASAPRRSQTSPVRQPDCSGLVRPDGFEPPIGVATCSRTIIVTRIKTGPIDLSQIKALTFDVGGTVFDWRGTIEAEVRELAKQQGADSLDVTEFAIDWRRGMFAKLARVRSRELPWMNADDLHRSVLDDVLDKHTAHPLRVRAGRA